MDTFTASNGINVTRVFDGEINYGIKDFLYKHDADALREFFRAEEDERLGRWRWPDNTEFVVYPIREGYSAENGCDLLIVNEVWGAALDFVASEAANYDEHDIPFVDAARAYFDAHPEPKPWHDAQPGEVWELRTVAQTRPYFVVEDFAYEPPQVFFSGPELRRLELTDMKIDAGRRIWPEVD